MAGHGQPPAAVEHRVDLDCPPGAALAAVGKAAEAWGADWQRGIDGGRLGLPLAAGVRHGIARGEVRIEPAAGGSRVSFRTEETVFWVQTAAVAILALAAGGAALYLVLDTREDAATEADIEDLREELTGVRETAAEAAQEDLQSINRSLADLEDQIGRLENEQGTLTDELEVAQDDIRELRDQVSKLETDGTGGGPP